MNKTTLKPVKLLAILLALAFSNAAFSQDDIIMLNNDVVKAKVDEVGVSVIKYRKLDNLDGPQYDVPKANVYMIIYANGSRDVINAQPGTAVQNSGTEDNLPAPPDGVNPNANVSTAPPPIPTYEQPICPTEGYIWTPGYWAYGLLGYYWVPGVWLAPARPGYLWTPGYWYFAGGFYRWHGGYWGEHIGYYGGVYYGYGYTGSGYYGGRWEGGYFRYNTAVSNVNVTVVHNTYVDKTVVNNTTVNRASYNGAGGVTAEPTVAERSAMNEQHVNVTPEQQAHVAAARSDQSQYVSVNKGTPAIAAMNKPGGQAFSPAGKATVAHPNTVTPAQHPTTTQSLQQGKQSSTMQENKPAQATPAQKEINAAPPTKEMSSTPAQKEISSAPPATQTKASPANTTKQNIKSNQKSVAQKKAPRQAPKPASHAAEHR